MTAPVSGTSGDHSGSTSGTALPPETTHAVLQLCRAMDAASVYGLKHPLFSKAVSAAHAAMDTALSRTPRLVITMIDAKLRFNGVAPAMRSNLTRHLSSAMKSKDLTSFTITKGMKLEEFTRLIDVLIRRDADFHEAVQSGAVGHVSSQNVVFREIREGEEVVKSSPLEQARQHSEADRIRAEAEAWLASTEQGGRGGGKGDDQGGDGQASSAGLQQIVAFLKGDVQSLGAEGDEAMKELASDPEKLAALITEAAVLRQRRPDLSSGETLSDLVIGCLRRSYEGLKASSALRDPQRRHELKHTLMLLEKKVSDRLSEITRGGDPSADARIAMEIAAIQSDLKDEPRPRDMRFGKAGAAGGAATRVPVMGEDRESWRKITVQGGEAHGGGGGGSAAADMAALAMVLTRIDELMRTPGTDRTFLGRLVREASQRAGSITSRTVKRIDRLARDIAVPSKSEKVELARQRERWLLAEIVQELLQPLTVMNCTLQMVSLGLSGEMDDGVRDAVSMAGEAGDRIETLTKRLLEITGVPEQLTVDRDRIAKDIYRD